jgi:hypothetical protein
LVCRPPQRCLPSCGAQAQPPQLGPWLQVGAPRRRP